MLRRNKDKELNIQEHTGLGQGTFGTCFGLVKGMELYVPSGFITSYCYAWKWGYVSMKELEELPAWWGEGISSSSSPSEDEAENTMCKYYYQAEIWKGICKIKKFDFRKEEKYRSSN